MDAAGCRHRPKQARAARPVRSTPSAELTEAKRRLNGWTNHAELAEYVIAELRQKLANHRPVLTVRAGLGLA